MKDNERQIVEEDDKSNLSVGTVLKVGLGIYALNAIFGGNKNTELSQEQLDLHQQTLDSDFDPIVNISAGEDPIFSREVVDVGSEFIDYEQAVSLVSAFRQKIAQHYAESVASMNTIPDEVIAGMIQAATDNRTKDVYAGQIKVYFDVVKIWQLLTKPVLEASQAFMTAGIQALANATNLSLKPSKIAYIKEVNTRTEQESLVTTITRNRQSSAGLLNFSNFNLLGGQSTSRTTITKNYDRFETEVTVGWVPFIEEYDIDPNIYELALEQAESLFGPSALLLKSVMESAPKYENFFEKLPQPAPEEPPVSGL